MGSISGRFWTDWGGMKTYNKLCQGAALIGRVVMGRIQGEAGFDLGCNAGMQETKLGCGRGTQVFMGAHLRSNRVMWESN